MKILFEKNENVQKVAGVGPLKKLCMPGFELQTFGDESDSSVPLSLLFNDCLLHGLILHQNYR